MADRITHRTARRVVAEARYRAARVLDARNPGPGPLLPCYWYASQPNFGDTLTAPILRCVLGLKPVLVHRNHQGKVLAVGSVLNSLRSRDVVWGSGAIEDQRIDGRGVRFLAVRGPLTRAAIDGDVPEVYGDPSILLPDIYQPRASPRFEVGVVPHYCDNDIMAVSDPSVSVINMSTTDWQGVIDRIAACDVVVSSSLHGIIVAESYGVPAIWVQPSDRIRGGRFKFDDYYQSTERDGKLFRWSDGLAALTQHDWTAPIIDREALLGVWPTEWGNVRVRLDSDC